MFLSVITITLNNFPGLQATWKSLLKQDCQDFEWIIIDGGSKDATCEFLPKSNAHYVSEKDSGIYDAMNKGLARALGEYVIFLNAGDRFATPHTIDTFKNAAQNKPDFIYGDSYENAAQKLHYKPARASGDIAHGMFTHHQAMIYKTETLGHMRFNTDYKLAADYDFTARFLNKTKNVNYIPLPLCIFESGGLSQKNAGRGRREEFKIRRNLKLASLSEAAVSYTKQSLIWQIRQHQPGLYWAMKSSRNNAPANAQTRNPLTHPESPALKNNNAQTPSKVLTVSRGKSAL